MSLPCNRFALDFVRFFLPFVLPVVEWMIETIGVGNSDPYESCAAFTS